MAQGAVSQHKDAQIEALKAQLQAQQATAAGGAIIRDVPVDQIDPFQVVEQDGDLRLIRQPRTYFDLHRLEALADSMDAETQREPISLRLLQSGRFGIMDGERRWRGRIMRGHLTVKAIVEENVSDEEALARAITTDSLKEKVSPLEQTISVVNLLRLRLRLNEAGVRKLLYARNNQAIGNSKGGDIDAETNAVIDGVVNSLGLELGSLVARLPLLDLPKNIREQVNDGQLSPTNALLITRAPEDLHQQLLEEGGQLSKAELRERIKDLKAGRVERRPELDMRDRLHQRYTQVRSKRTWKKIEADPKLRRKAQKIELLMEDLLSAVSGS
jgi:ParB family chromosome partitioning protein